MKKRKPIDKQNIKKKALPYESKSTIVVYLVLRALVVLTLVWAAVNKQWESVFTCGLVLVLFLMPSIVEKRFSFKMPSTLEIIILFFIFAAEILGELQAFYIKYHFWDTMLHTTNGFLCAAFGYGMVDLLNRNDKIKMQLSPFFLAFVSFCFSMTIGVLWEFFEFGMDRIFLTDMQKDTVVNVISSTMLDPTASNKSVIIRNVTDVVVNGENLGLGGYLDIGLFDTMKDLFVNFIGAVVFSVIGFFASRNRSENKITENLVPKLANNKDEKK